MDCTFENLESGGSTRRAGALRTIIAVICVLGAFVPLAFAAQASADTNANTDDSQVSSPTGWWTYTNVSRATIASHLQANGARLTDIEPFDPARGRWTVTMVKNSGQYAVAGWWWYVGLTGAQVSERLTANSARLVHIQPYTVNGATRFAAVMVNNTGAQAREWYWGYGKTTRAISSHLSTASTRLTDLEPYDEGTARRYAFISVKNTGEDANGWYWWLGQSGSELRTRLTETGARLIDLERRSDNRFDAVAVLTSGHDSAASWYRFGFESMAEVNNYAAQLAARPLDVETYVTLTGARRYDAVFIDNANAATRRIRDIYTPAFLETGGSLNGIFTAYLERVGGPVLVDLNSRRRAETASSLKALHLLHALRQGEDLSSRFTYYDYPSSPYFPSEPHNACPNPAEETAANRRTNTLEWGLDEMMRVSDNRTTRGVVLRYGGFSALNTTAHAVGLTGTRVRHNIGCAYSVVGSDPPRVSTSLRNDTTAWDLASIYRTVWQRSTLSGTPRAEFLESVNPSTFVPNDDGLHRVITEEANRLGKPTAVRDEFALNVRRWGKAGIYGTCLPASDGSCKQPVDIRSGAGLVQLPVKGRGGVISHRTYAFARFYSDARTFARPASTYAAAYENVRHELYREEIRKALATW